MKQSWIIGTLMLWMMIMMSELMATNGTAFTATNTGYINRMASPDLVNSAGASSALTTIITHIGTYLVAFINAIFLWSPTVFAGNWYYAWMFFCLPIAISFIIVILTILRGVHSS